MAVIIFYMSDVGLVCCKKGVSSRIMYRKLDEMELSLLQCERLPNIFDMLHIFLSCPQLDGDCDYLNNDCVIYFGVIF